MRYTLLHQRGKRQLNNTAENKSLKSCPFTEYKENVAHRDTYCYLDMNLCTGDEILVTVHRPVLLVWICFMLQNVRRERRQHKVELFHKDMSSNVVVRGNIVMCLRHLVILQQQQHSDSRTKWRKSDVIVQTEAWRIMFHAICAVMSTRVTYAAWTQPVCHSVE